MSSARSSATRAEPHGCVAAIEVCSRLWAGSVLGRRSSRNATAVLNDVILRGRVVGFPLIATDGSEYDVGVSERLFGALLHEDSAGVRRFGLNFS